MCSPLFLLLVNALKLNDIKQQSNPHCRSLGINRLCYWISQKIVSFYSSLKTRLLLLLLTNGAVCARHKTYGIRPHTQIWWIMQKDGETLWEWFLFSVTLSRYKRTCSLFMCYFRIIMQCNVMGSSHLFSVVSPVLRMCLQRSSGKGRWNGWTCSATGTSGWSRDSIRSAPGFNLIMQNVSWLVCMSCMVLPNWIFPDLLEFNLFFLKVLESRHLSFTSIVSMLQHFTPN